jgi:hypothetical protein
VPLGAKQTVWGAACQLNSDCAAGLTCQSGHCARSCNAATDCPNQTLVPAAGSAEINCRPCTTDLECGNGLCLEGAGFEQFCGTECVNDSECPAGFVCQQSASYSGKGCAPAAGSCHAPLCQQSTCTLPAASYGEACSADADCSTGKCVEGLCTRGCATDDDCGCSVGDLVCREKSGGGGKFCLLSSSFTKETEGNDSFNVAQVLESASTIVVAGELRQQPGSLDVDYFRVSLKQNQVLEVKADPVCGFGSPGLDAQMQLYNSSNGYLTGDYPYTKYPHIRDYKVPADGDYIIALRNTSYGLSTPAAYVLTISAR